MTAIEKARIAERRVFYCEYSDTVRLAPENYCLANQGLHGWQVYEHEGMNKPYRALIAGVISEIGKTSSGTVLADKLNERIP